MLLKLNNVGMIESAEIKLNGLSVIAGENDCGKSTIGKVLFTLIKADMISFFKIKTNQATTFASNRILNMNKQIALVFKHLICRRDRNKVYDAFIELQKEEEIYYQVQCTYSEGKDICRQFVGLDEKRHRDFKDALIIQTPFLWDISKTLSDIATLNQERELLGIATRVNYPYILWDLFVKLRPGRMEEEILYSEILSQLTDDILQGRVVFKENGEFFFQFQKERGALEIPVENLSSGGRSFLTLQALLFNNLLEPSRFVIIDEPEVHLHPKWQIEYAKIIVELVKKGIYVLIVTHSPYMLEALEIFSKKSEVEANFYFAQKEGSVSRIVDVTDTTETIYRSLAEPIDILEEIDIEQNRW